jgi:hypothetical protein
MTVRTHAPLNGYHQRKMKNWDRTYVAPNGQLPPADVLRAIGAPEDIAAQVQTFHDLKVAENDHARKASAANGAAERASTDYRRAVREAIANGEDPEKVKDQTDRHKAVAKAHAEFSADARAQRERLGHELGPQLEALAPSLFAEAEREIDAAAAVLTEALAGIRATWSQYSAAFQLRYWLSHVALDGGTAAVYHGATNPPAVVLEAIDGLRHEVDAIARLRADESQVLRYREENGGGL